MKKRKNLRWEEMDKGNLELNDLAKHFEAFNRSEGKSDLTVSWYNQVLRLFREWLESEEQPTNLGAVGETEVRSFIIYLREKRTNGKPTSTHTVSNRVRALRAFFAWLARKGYTESHILADLRPPRTSDPVIEPLTIEEIDRLFGSINQNTMMGARNTAMLALFLDTGLRLAELSNLTEPNVHLDQRYVKVLGKGGKERIVPLGVNCQRTLLHYFHHFRPEPANPNCDSFFLTIDGYPVTKDAVASMVDRLAITAGIKRLHPHLLRHTYATRFLLNGGDVFLLQQNLGHTTLAMVQHYRHIASREAALLSETFSPLDRMDLKEMRHRRRNDGFYGAIYPNAGQPRNNNHGDARDATERGNSLGGHYPTRTSGRRASLKGRTPQRA